MVFLAVEKSHEVRQVCRELLCPAVLAVQVLVLRR